MARVVMREIRAGEVPFAAGTAVQEDPGRPVFRGNGPDDYVCVSCGNLLAESMDAEYMSKKVRVRCGRCRTVNVAVTGAAGPSTSPSRATSPARRAALPRSRP